MFDEKLNLADFKRTYRDRHLDALVKEPSVAEYDKIYKQLLKNDEKSRTLNCTACGYDTCQEMVKAIYNNLNVPENCIYFNRETIILDHEKLRMRDAEIGDLEELNRLNEERIERDKLIIGNIDEIIGAVDQISTGSEENALEIHNISQEVSNVLESAHNLRDDVAEMSDKLSRFSNASEQIIQIAGQTDLLALNATIEAARAGEEGRGFAVVAEEVRKLSASSNDVAFSTQKDQEEMVHLNNKISEISKGIEEQMDLINKSTNNISTNIDDVSEKSHEISAAADEILKK